MNNNLIDPRHCVSLSHAKARLAAAVAKPSLVGACSRPEDVKQA